MNPIMEAAMTKSMTAMMATISPGLLVLAAGTSLTLVTCTIVVLY